MDEEFEKKTSDLSAMFSSFQSYLDEDQDIREKTEAEGFLVKVGLGEHVDELVAKNKKISVAVRDIEQTTREILAVLQAVHHSSNQEDIVKTCQKANSLFTNVKDQFSQLIIKIPAGQYYRFHDHWRFVSQRASFLASFLVYLQFDRLITREEVALMLGLKVKREDGFHIDLNDFLMGLLLLANELSRYAVNCVTAGEYEQPQKIASFVSQLDAGFRLLNLKNDALRRKFDGLKYDLKKIEEVVYDIKIRGLKNS